MLLYLQPFSLAEAFSWHVYFPFLVRFSSRSQVRILVLVLVLVVRVVIRVGVYRRFSHFVGRRFILERFISGFAALEPQVRVRVGISQHIDP